MSPSLSHPLTSASQHDSLNCELVSRDTPKRKSMRGHPEIYSEKKERKCLALTPTAIHILKKTATAYDLSQSELIEQTLRGLITPTFNQIANKLHYTRD